MNHQQAVQTVMAYLDEAYPTSTPPADPRRRVQVWAESLEGADPERLLATAKAWVSAGNKFMPNLGEFHATMRDCAYGSIPSEAEAWEICTSSASTADAHPILRRVVQITGGRNSLAWMEEREARRAVRGAYFSSLQQFKIDSDPAELPQRSLDSRRGGEPQPIGPG